MIHYYGLVASWSHFHAAYPFCSVLTGGEQFAIICRAMTTATPYRRMLAARSVSKVMMERGKVWAHEKACQNNYSDRPIFNEI